MEKEEYIFLNKKYEQAVTVIKAQLFDIISNEEKKAMRIGLEMSREGISEEKLRSLQELALRQGEDLGRVITLASKLYDTLVRLDSYTKILRDLRKEKASTAEVEKNVQDTAAEVIVSINETNVSQDTKDKVIENVGVITEVAQVPMPDISNVQPLEEKKEEVPAVDAVTKLDDAPVITPVNEEEKTEEVKVDVASEVKEEVVASENAGTPLIVVDGDAATENGLAPVVADATAVVVNPLEQEAATLKAEEPAQLIPVEEVAPAAEPTPEVVSEEAAPLIPVQEEQAAPAVVEETPAAAPLIAVEEATPAAEPTPEVVVEEAAPLIPVQEEQAAPAEVAPEAPAAAPLIAVEEVAPAAEPTPEVVAEEAAPLIPVQEEQAAPAEVAPEAPATAPLIQIQEEQAVPVETVAETNTVAFPSDAAEVVEEAANEEKAVEEKPKFIKEDKNNPKALLTSAKQIGNLRKSYETQEALLGARQQLGVSNETFNTAGDTLETQLVQTGLLPADVETMKKQVEQMMEQANTLYKDGKTDEAQAMYTKISELNKQIQEKTNNSLSV